MRAMEVMSKLLILPFCLVTGFIFFGLIYTSITYKDKFTIFSLIRDSQSIITSKIPPSIDRWLHLNDHIAPLVIIDPNWIRCLSHSPNLTERSNPCSTNGTAEMRLALLVNANNQSKLLMKKFLEVSLDNGWHWDKDAWRSGFLRLTKENSIVIVSIMEKRKHYWYLSGIQHDHSRAFYGLNLTQLNQHHRQLLIPSPIDLYLWQWPRSKFLECNVSSAKYLLKRYHKLYEVKPVIPDDIVDAMAYVRDIFTHYRISILMEGGTALGWYRECGIIPHTNDVDMMFLAWEWDQEIIKILKNDSILNLERIENTIENGLEMVSYPGGSRLDIFALYDNGNESYIGDIITSQGEKVRWWLPKFDDVCTGALNEQLFFVRCDILAVLKRQYGPEWYEHSHTDNYQWDRSHFNIQRTR